MPGLNSNDILKLAGLDELARRERERGLDSTRDLDWSGVRIPVKEPAVIGSPVYELAEPEHRTDNILYRALSNPQLNSGLNNLIDNAYDIIMGSESGNPVVDYGTSNIPGVGPASILAAGGIPGAVDFIGASGAAKGAMKTIKGIANFADLKKLGETVPSVKIVADRLENEPSRDIVAALLMHKPLGRILADVSFGDSKRWQKDIKKSFAGDMFYMNTDQKLAKLVKNLSNPVAGNKMLTSREPVDAYIERELRNQIKKYGGQEKLSGDLARILGSMDESGMAAVRDLGSQNHNPFEVERGENLGTFNKLIAAGNSKASEISPVEAFGLLGLSQPFEKRLKDLEDQKEMYDALMEFARTGIKDVELLDKPWGDQYHALVTEVTDPGFRKFASNKGMREIGAIEADIPYIPNSFEIGPEGNMNRLVGWQMDPQGSYAAAKEEYRKWLESKSEAENLLDAVVSAENGLHSTPRDTRWFGHKEPRYPSGWKFTEKELMEDAGLDPAYIKRTRYGEPYPVDTWQAPDLNNPALLQQIKENARKRVDRMNRETWDKFTDQYLNRIAGEKLRGTPYPRGTSLEDTGINEVMADIYDNLTRTAPDEALLFAKLRDAGIMLGNGNPAVRTLRDAITPGYEDDYLEMLRRLGWKGFAGEQ